MPLVLSLTELLRPCVGVLLPPAPELLLLTIGLDTVPFKRLELLELELFNPGKFPPTLTETFAILLLLLLVLLLLLFVDVGVLCAFGIMPFDWGDRTADGSIDSEPIAFGSPDSSCGSLVTPEFLGEDNSVVAFGVTGLFISLRGLVLELGVMSILSSRIRAGLFAS